MKHSIRTRIIASQVVIILIIIAMIFFVMNMVIMRNIDKLEANDIDKNVEMLSDLIASDLNDLVSQTHDYSGWDDTYFYVQNRNEDYITNNFYSDVLCNIDINLLAIVDDRGNLLYGDSIDLSSGERLPFPQDLISSLSKTNIFSNKDPDYHLEGILMLPEGPVEICAAPVLTSQNTGEVSAHFIFGRYLSALWMQKLSGQSKLKLYSERLDQLDVERSLYYRSITDADPIKIVKPSNNKIEATFIIRDVFQKPALGITVETNREARAIGQQGLNLIILLLSLISLGYLLLGIHFWDKSLLNRLRHISSKADDIGKNHTFSMRLPPEKVDDELSIVTGKINFMLDELEGSQLALQAARDNLEKLVEARTNDLVNVNNELTEEKEKIKHLAYHDHLTGLPNGLMLNDFISHALETANRTSKTLALLFLDLDGFKMINDTLGHSAGDQLLIAVSGRLTITMRKSDIVARIGGDEFCILIENISEIEPLDSIAEKILQCFSDPFYINNQECFLSTSIGIAIYPTDGATAENLIKNADLAMYRAKEEGRNRFCYCTPEMKDKVIDNMRLSNQLWRALERKELEIYYQPQVNNYTKEIVGLEALLRWNHPEFGMIHPDRFISLAEQTGSINVIGAWVLETACRQCKHWQDLYYPQLRIAVNLSVKQFQSRNIRQIVEEVLSTTQISPQMLDLEITENIAAKEASNIIQTLTELKKLGIKIAIDDFGTDYSSMNYLKQFPVDRIKLAMSFVKGISVSEKDEAIVKSVLLLAKSMKIGVIAEGVETKAQFDFLTKRLCDETQGFYFFKPMPADQIEELLAAHSKWSSNDDLDR